MNRAHLRGCFLWESARFSAWLPVQSAEPTLRPVVEVQEEVYRYADANNGAGPMWCSGSTCLVRVGDQVVASGIETLPDVPPLNNCRWLLLARRDAGWNREQADPQGRTREPSPLAVFPDGTLFLSANPTLMPPGTYCGCGPSGDPPMELSQTWRLLPKPFCPSGTVPPPSPNIRIAASRRTVRGGN